MNLQEQKRTATFTPHPQQQIQVGRPAYVFGVKHYNPDIKGALVRTSNVTRILDNGGFETINTIYQPAHGAEEHPPAPTS